MDRQRASFRRYGVWGDWDEPYLTLQPEYEAAQIRVFGDMVLKVRRQWGLGGLIQSKGRFIHSPSLPMSSIN